MAQWGSSRRVAFSQGDETQNSYCQLSACVVKEYQKDEDEEAVASESLVMRENGKRKCPLPDAKPTGRKKQRQRLSGVYAKPKPKPKSKRHENSADRWSVERYKQAEQSLMEILKAEGAVFGKPISRPELRVAGRKRIGDTGLLDHLLKHIDGKVAPGGSERFRRWHNTDGVMEYWLESADLVDIRREAGVEDPYWVPPSGWKPGTVPGQESVSAAEFRLLKEEMANMKRQLEELVDKKPGQDQVNQVEEMHKEWMNWKAKTNQRLMEISSSLSGMQCMYRDLTIWKAKAEQQLIELSNSLSSMAAKQYTATTLSPPTSERWEDWLESTNLDNFQGEDITPWLESNTVINAEKDAAMQNPYTSLPRSKPGDYPMPATEGVKELVVVKEDMARVKRDVSEHVPKKQEVAVDNSTQGSSVTVNSKVELDNSFLLLQEMFKELAKWKAKIEQQLMEVSNAVNSMQLQTPKQFANFNSPTFYL